MTSPPLPAATRCCLFLDIDGTLLDFASTPDGVRVDEPLRALLRQLDRLCEGAVAFVSGRSITDIDELFEPLYFAAAGVHGCERRDADGKWMRPAFRGDGLGDFLDRIRGPLSALDGVLIEDKGCAAALHYRRAPQVEAPLRALLLRFVASLPPSYELFEGDHVFEIKPATFTKATAIEAFMQEAPFAGRFPIFIGDDSTDLDGFAAIRRYKGLAIGVGQRITTDWLLPNPAAVRRWLESFLLRRAA
jgi:trehalose 6-phosphate phosphatase